MIRQDQPGGVPLTSTLFRRKTTASIPKSVTRLFNQTISHNVFDIDNGDDSEDLVILGEKVGKINKGKAIEVIHQVDGHGSIMSYEHGDDSEDLVILGEQVSKSNNGKAIEAIHQIVEVSDNNLCQSSMEKFRTVSETSYPLVTNDIINIDCHGSDLSYGYGYDSKELVIIGEEVSKSNKGKQIEAPHQVVPSIEYFGPTSGIESSNAPPLVYLSYDDGDDSDDLMIIGEEVNKSNNQGKTIEAIQQEVSDYTFCQPAEKSIGSVAQDVIDIDDDDDFDDLMIIGVDAGKSNKGKTIEVIPEVVAHLDKIDIPSRTEAPFTSFRESDKGLKRSTFESNDKQSASTNINPRQPPTSTNFESATKAASVCNSSSMNQAHLDNVNIPSRNEAPFTLFRESDIDSRRSTFESSTWYDSQSEATNINPRKTPTSTNFESATKATSFCNSSSMNQAHLDNINIPSRTEAPFTSFRDSGIGLRRSTFESSSWYDTQSVATNINTYKPPEFTSFERATKASSVYNSSSMNQAHLDNINIPSRTEAPFTSFRDSGIGLRSSTFESSNWYGTQSEATNSHLKASSQPSQSLERGNSKNQGSTMGSSTLQNKVDNTYDSTGTPFSSPLFYQATPNKRKSTAPTPLTSTNLERTKKACLNNVDIATPNKRKSTTTSANFRSAKKAHLDNVDISYEIGAPFTLFSESNLGSRKSALEGSAWYGTQSKATNSQLKASSQSSQLSKSANSEIQRSTIGSSNLQIEMDNVGHSFGIGLSASQLYSGASHSKKKSTALQSVAGKKKAASSMRLLDASKPSAATKIISGKKAVGSGSKNSQTTSSSNSSLLLDSGALMGSSLFSHSVSFKKKADAPMRLITASKPSAATKTVSGKKTVGSGSQNSQAKSSSKPSHSLDSGAVMGSSLFSRSVSSKKKAETPMRLIHASEPPAATKILSGKKAVGSGSKQSHATSSSKPSRSLDSGAPSMKKQAAPKASNSNVGHSYGTGLSSPLLLTQAPPSKKKSQAAPMKLLKASKSSTATKSKSCKQKSGSSRTNGRVNNSSTGLPSVAAPSCLLLEYKWQVLQMQNYFSQNYNCLKLVFVHLL